MLGRIGLFALGLAALLILFLIVAGIGSAQGERLVLAYYYAWFDAHTWILPLPDKPLAPYSSADVTSMRQHVEQAQGAGIDAFVLAWLGPQNPTDDNFKALLSVAEAKGFRVCIGLETDSPFLGDKGKVKDALAYLLSQHGQHPAYLRVGGKPVVFFWRVSALPGGVEDWEEIRAQVDPQYQSLWISEGVDLAHLRIFDGHHLYSIAWSADVAATLKNWGNKVRRYGEERGLKKLWVATVMPGYDDRATGRADAFVRDRQGGQFYRHTWEAAMASQPDWIIITSFNEWLEGSHIQPSVNYGQQYLELTRELSAAFKGEGLAPAEVASAATPAVEQKAPTATFSPTLTSPPTATPTSTVTSFPTVTPTWTPTATGTPTPVEKATVSSWTPTPVSEATPIPTAAKLGLPLPCGGGVLGGLGLLGAILGGGGAAAGLWLRPKL